MNADLAARILLRQAPRKTPAARGSGMAVRQMPWTALRKACSRILTDTDTGTDTDTDTDNDTPPKC